MSFIWALLISICFAVAVCGFLYGIAALFLPELRHNKPFLVWLKIRKPYPDYTKARAGSILKVIIQGAGNIYEDIPISHIGNIREMRCYRIKRILNTGDILLDNDGIVKQNDYRFSEKGLEAFVNIDANKNLWRWKGG